MKDPVEIGLIAALIAVVVATAVVSARSAKPSTPQIPTVAESYRSLQFDITLYETKIGIVCGNRGVAAYTSYVRHPYIIAVQLGDKCLPTNDIGAYTYDSIAIGTKVTLKMDTSGAWWARRVSSNF